jgi:hypothetical protein
VFGHVFRLYHPTLISLSRRLVDLRDPVVDSLLDFSLNFLELFLVEPSLLVLLGLSLLSLLRSSPIDIWCCIV